MDRPDQGTIGTEEPGMRLAGARVLIVDDDHANRQLLAGMLRQAGIDHIRAEAAPDGIDRMVLDFDPHLVFLDLHMGDSNGFEALQVLADHDPQHGRRPLVLLTGDTAPEVRSRALELGAHDVLVKPYDMAGLRPTVERRLGSNEAFLAESESNGGNGSSAEPVERIDAANGSPVPDFKLLFESAPGLYLVLDPDLVIVAASDAYLQATMTNREGIVGRKLFDVFPENPGDPDDTEQSNLRASFDRVLSERVPDTVAVLKYDIPRPESEGSGFETRYWSPRNSPVPGPDGAVAYILNQVEDVTEFVRLIERDSAQRELTAELQEQKVKMEAEIVQRSGELQEANRQLRAASDAKNEFLSRVSHELRTPLTSILGFGELLSLGEMSEEQLEWAEMILTAGRHLLGLLNDVLDISRIESGDLSLSLEPVSVEEILVDTVDLIRPLAAPLDLEVRFEGDAVAHRYVLGDRQRLRQVIINLLSNAVKYNRPGGAVTIAVTEGPADEYLRIGVTDTGAGLSEEELAKLFVPFERLSASQTGIEGTGLGLVLSRRLAENMGGTLGVSSTVGTGSTFWVELQAVEPAVLDDEDVRRHTVGRPRSYAGPKRVLYVEDMVANVRLVEEILKRRPDITLVPAMLGGLALDLAREHQPDLVLLDLHLPDVGGHEVMRRLKADAATREIPVVVLSADATERQLHRLLGAGATDYLTKPIAVHRLLGVVDELLGEADASPD